MKEDPPYYPEPGICGCGRDEWNEQGDPCDHEDHCEACGVVVTEPGRCRDCAYPEDPDEGSPDDEDYAAEVAQERDLESRLARERETQ